MNRKYRYSELMGSLSGRLKREHGTLVCMTEIYCNHHHGLQDDGLCDDCAKLMTYAERRLEKCPYGEKKPTCANCPVHCYKPARRKQAREIMRYAGPRMLLRHPLLAIAHQIDGFRRAMHPGHLTREQRLKSRKD